MPRDADARTIIRVRSAGSPAAITRTPAPTAIGQLPPRHRLAVQLADVKGLSCRQIADLTGIPVGTVKSSLHRGRGQLRARLGAHPGGAGLCARGRGGQTAPPHGLAEIADGHHAGNPAIRQHDRKDLASQRRASSGAAGSVGAAR